MFYSVIPRYFHLKIQKKTLTEEKLRNWEVRGKKKCHHLYGSNLTDNKAECVYPLKHNKTATTRWPFWLPASDILLCEGKCTGAEDVSHRPGRVEESWDAIRRAVLQRSQGLRRKGPVLSKKWARFHICLGKCSFVGLFGAAPVHRTPPPPPPQPQFY